MQTSKIYIKPLRLSENLVVLPVNQEVCEIMDISFKDILQMEFIVTIIEGRLRIEAVPSKTAASIDDNSGQGADING